MRLKYQDVFVPGGFPLHTYNPRAELQLEQRLSEAKENLCKLVTVTGHTKSGKTVLANKVFPREEAIWVDGGLVSQEDDLWMNIVEELDLFQSVERETSSDTIAKVGGTAKAEANFLVTKGSGEISTELEKSRHGHESRKEPVLSDCCDPGSESHEDTADYRRFSLCPEGSSGKDSASPKAANF